MKGGKDEGKPLDPLFPRLHINDADKGGPRAPPRNKMALCEQFNVPPQSLKLGLGSIAMLPLPPTNSCSSFVQPPSSSSNVGGPKPKVLPTFGSIPGSSQSAERYSSSYCSNRVIPSMSLTTNSEQWMLGPTYQNPRGVSSLNSCSIKSIGDENYFKRPSFLQLGKNLSCGNLQQHLDEEKVGTNFSLMPSGEELHNACLKLLKETKNGDEASEKNTKLSQSNDIFPEKPFFISSFRDKISSEKLTRKRSAAALDDSSSPRIGDCNKLSKMDLKKELSKDSDKREGISDTFKEDSLLGIHLTTDDVVRVLGETLFSKARKTIIHQQRIFSMQIFELHRLVKVQRLIAGSPGMLKENNFQTEKPFIQFPPMNKLLYLTPLDPLPTIAKSKLNPLKSNPIRKECDAKAEKGHISPHLTPNPLPLPSPIPTDAKLAPPWCFHPPHGNHWLVPVTSPSEGLIYKPYTGSSFPSLGFLGPVYGNCLPINLSPLAGPTYEHKENGTGHLYGHNYPHASTASNLEAEMKAMKLPKESSPQSALASDCGGNYPVEQSEGDTLSLFPTTPSVKDSKDESNGQSAQVIKVVPHNRRSAPESAARIFQSIQEERRKF